MENIYSALLSVIITRFNKYDSLIQINLQRTIVDCEILLRNMFYHLQMI